MVESPSGWLRALTEGVGDPDRRWSKKLLRYVGNCRGSSEEVSESGW